jgi:hypothetical protein
MTGVQKRVRFEPALLVILALGGCITGSDRFGTGIWAADIDRPDRVLVMTLVQEDSELNGTGFLALLNSPASQSLVLSGTRIADTVDITFQRQAGEPFRFTGYLTAKKTLLGVLDGAEFAGLTVAFKQQ